MNTISGTHENAPADRTRDSSIAGGLEAMTYEEMSEFMFRARTLEQIAVAWQVRSAYLQAQPDDTAILKEGESLWMREQALMHPDEPTAPPQAERAA